MNMFCLLDRKQLTETWSLLPDFFRWAKLRPKSMWYPPINTDTRQEKCILSLCAVCLGRNLSNNYEKNSASSQHPGNVLRHWIGSHLASKKTLE